MIDISEYENFDQNSFNEWIKTYKEGDEIPLHICKFYLKQKLKKINDAAKWFNPNDNEEGSSL